MEGERKFLKSQMEGRVLDPAPTLDSSAFWDPGARDLPTP